MLNYKTEILSNVEKLDKKQINQMFKEVKNKIEPNIIINFNLDSFFRGLSNIVSVKKNKKINIEKFFKSYISNLPKRIELLNEENILEIHLEYPSVYGCFSVRSCTW